MKRLLTILLLLILSSSQAQQKLPLLKVSPNGRFFQTEDGKPFFWLGDTGWLLFGKCKKEEAIQYLDIRQAQGFNVIQVMVLHTLRMTDAYGDSALIDKNIANPYIAQEESLGRRLEYDYWDNIDFVITEAEKRGIYIALVPIWGGNVKDGKVTAKQAESYAKFLALRYKKRNNIIWMNGGDIKGSEGLEVWEAIGKTLKKYDPAHLVTYHPRGRYSSSDWFHSESWLDFNMFQSGHRTYEQDTSRNEKNHFGEDNWKYVNIDYKLKPVKPTIDGEPSYENIPHGLHDSLQPRWKAADLRRYAYWSVFAGGAGFTYGENAVMQFNTKGDNGANYGVSKNWKEAVHSPGAEQMHNLNKLMLSRSSYFDRVPAQEIITDNTKDKYDYILATKGKKFAMAYTYTGINFKVDMSKLGFKTSRISWYDPSKGEATSVEAGDDQGVREFDPPGEPGNGHDWVLIIE
jgi:hypothetical protein